ncbi:MAG: hypothetical protein R6V19_15925 [Armatimonadota bacterium]
MDFNHLLSGVPAILCALMILWISASGANAQSQQEITRSLIDELEPLDRPLDGRLPIRGSRMGNWLPDDDAEAKQVLQDLYERGIALCCHWRPGNRFEENLKSSLRLGRLQQELGLSVGVNANSCMHTFFNGDKDTLHVAEDGSTFHDDSFGKRKMGCPFRLQHRKEDIKQQFRQFLDAYTEAGVDVDFMYLDWEIDGPIEWNEAWDHSKRCTVCRENVPDIDNFFSFQHALREIRCELQRECCVDVVQEYFPDILVSNYSVYPNNGWRYWYDYYEEVTPGTPYLPDQQARYRPWYQEFFKSGYTFANPVCYTWYRTFDWYPEFENDDYRWFYNMLLVGTNAAENTPQDVPLINWVHWHTTAPPSDAAPVPQFSQEKYVELLWHYFLRGTDGLMMWCRAEETVIEVRLMQQVLNGTLQYREFFEDGRPVLFDVPDTPGPVVSGMRLDDRVLVRRTDFTDNTDPVTVVIGGHSLDIPARPGVCQVLELE